MLVEIRPRNISHMILLRPLIMISVRPLCRPHQVVAAESRSVSCNDPGRGIALVLLSAHVLAGNWGTALVLVDNAATFEALALAPVRSLIFVETRQSIVARAANSREPLSLKGTLHVRGCSLSHRVSCVDACGTWQLTHLLFAQCEELFDLIL